MAINFIDGFDLYGTASNVGRKWDSATGTFSIVSGRVSGSAIRVTSPGAGSTTIQKTVVAAQTGGVSLAHKTVTPDAIIPRCFIFLLNSGTIHLAIGFNTANQLVVFSGTGTLLGTSVTAFGVGSWFHFEMKWNIDNTTGSIEIRANGSVTPALNITGVDTQNGGSTTVNDIRLTTDGSSSQVFDIDDLVVWDTTGSSPQNNFMGDIRVETIRPSAPGNSTNWTPNTGTNWEAVDDTTPDDDTTFVSTAVSGTKDTYTMSNLTSTVATIFATQSNLLIKKTDAGTADVKSIVRTGGTDFASSAQGVSTSYTYITDMRTINPNTSVAWTGADIDGSEWGAEFN